MLIPDLLNILFDQSDYRWLVVLRSLGKRKTKYANKYSVLSYYGAANMNLEQVVKLGLTKIIKMSIEHIDIDAALCSSAKNGNILAVKYLVGVGADIDYCLNFWDGNALLLSANYGHLEVVKYLISVDAGDDYLTDSALLLSAAGNGHLEVAKYLISVGRYSQINKNSALRHSADNGHLEVVKYLVSVGANIHADNDAALQFSALEGHLKVVEYLISVGADIHVCNDVLFELKIISDNFSHLKNT